MSSTKIVIVVLVLVALLFVIFVVKGGLSKDQPKQGNRNDASEFSRKKEAPGWSRTINNLFNSLKPKAKLRQEKYSGGDKDVIAPDEKERPFRTVTFRTVTFRMISGLPIVNYKDRIKDVPDALKDLKEQDCVFPNVEGDDPNLCSIVALKLGGELTFSCKNTNPCQVKVE